MEFFSVFHYDLYFHFLFDWPQLFTILSVYILFLFLYQIPFIILLFNFCSPYCDTKLHQANPVFMGLTYIEYFLYLTRMKIFSVSSLEQHRLAEFSDELARPKVYEKGRKKVLCLQFTLARNVKKGQNTTFKVNF